MYIIPDKNIYYIIYSGTMVHMLRCRHRFLSIINLVLTKCLGFQWLCNSLGYYEFRPNGKILLFAGKAFCEANSLAEGVCDNLLFLYAGYDSKRLIKVRVK